MEMAKVRNLTLVKLKKNEKKLVTKLKKREKKLKRREKRYIYIKKNSQKIKQKKEE